MPDDIDIRPIVTHDEMRAVEDVQRAAWNMQERDVVPMHLMVTWVDYGGVLLGAFDGEALLGFVLGYPGLLDADDRRAAWSGARVQHCSEMLAVRPEAQSTGIGFRLKVAQRGLLLERGFALATWTFDPLLSRNAHLNITRLGGICRSYKPNLYGELHGIYAGLPTDRLEVEWWLRSAHVESRIERGLRRVPPPLLGGWQKVIGTQVLNPSTARADGLRAPAGSVGAPAARRVMVEIPADLNALKAADMGLARAWQAQVRAALEGAFEEGYLIAWLTSAHDGAGRRTFYVLAAEEEFGLEDVARGEDR